MKVAKYRKEITKSSLEPITRLMLFALSSHMEIYQKPPTIKELAKACGLKERAIYSHLKSAENADYLIRIPVIANRDTNKYILTFPGDKMLKTKKDYAIALNILKSMEIQNKSKFKHTTASEV